MRPAAHLALQLLLTASTGLATAAAPPLRLSPWPCSHSTAGLRASARKSEMITQLMTCLAIQITSSVTATPMMMASSERTVRSLNRTVRSGITQRSIATGSDGLRWG